MSFVDTMEAALLTRKAEHRHRVLQETTREDGVYVWRNGKKLISFSCNDYLNLSQHPHIKQAAIVAIQKYGTGAGASRFITGNHPLYNVLEAKLAALKSTEAALVFGSGYLTNLGVIPALVGKGDLILADKFVHACLIDAAQLSGAKLVRFPHDNLEKCEALLAKHRSEHKHCLILTDRVFSMEGDLAPIDALLVLAERYDALLLSDDAHGLGVLPPPPVHPRHVQMGTLSKAVGGYGGYVCGTEQQMDYLRNHARTLIYSTALPPMVIAAAIAALEVIVSEPEYCARPLKLARYFSETMGLPEAQSPIVPVILGEEQAALDASHALEEKGFLVQAIRPPTVPPGTARLRFTFSAGHQEEMVENVVRGACLEKHAPRTTCHA